jgi:UDP-N-acetylmuramoyl-tripeptide--D-alanyl-D-alanine ligase
VLGEMRELGDHSIEEHAGVGDLVGARRIDVLVAVGAETVPMAEHAERAGVSVTRVVDASAALEAVADFVHDGDAVLVKGSRAVGLELVATALRGAPVAGDRA